MFDSVNQLLVQGERFTQSCCPGRIVYGGASFPAIISEIEYHERLDVGGFQVLKSCHCRLLRTDIPPAIQFKKGQDIQIGLKLHDGTHKVVTMQVGDANADSSIRSMVAGTAEPRQ